MIAALFIGIPFVLLITCGLVIFLTKSNGLRKAFSIAAILLGTAGLLFGVYGLSDMSSHRTDIDRLALLEATDSRYRGMSQMVQDMKSQLPVGMCVCVGVLIVGVVGLLRRPQAPVLVTPASSQRTST